MRLLVFGGTTEGRRLVDWMAARGSCDVVSYAATDYGESLVAVGPRVDSRSGRLDEGQMEQLMCGGDFACVVDATHPYATLVSENLRRASSAVGVPLVRVARESEPEGPWLGCASAATAAARLNDRGGTILLTTGSKDLDTFATGVSGFERRVYVRVLPTVASVARALSLGVRTDHLLAMQGPFSRELNRALIRQLGISILVTKASGSVGGFWEKVDAARDCGIDVLVIHRPVGDGDGLSLAAVESWLAQSFGI